MRLDGDDLVRARIDDGDIFEARILAVAEIARVIFQKSDAGKRILQELPFEDFGLAGAEHLKLGPERGIFRIAGDIAAGLRLLDHPAGDLFAQGLSLLGRHLLAEAHERLAAFGLKRILGESILIVGDSLVGAVQRL